MTALHRLADAWKLARLGVRGLTAERMRDVWSRGGATVELLAPPPNHTYQTTWWRKNRQREGHEPFLLRVMIA